ncbi:hypothetical protein F4V57_01490 [Acinetobacter qingfengensis]|uniref:Zinc finger/thioredoxin putative domain-containing protein n=1 Tax=Acinetobacter qingfengensis TaxID=1262585 RepID=A0A1E7R994_9GAMM|nr:MJ0042-type zinc finger domain-containing protein [Acinetobacter qingfengensis]KAA8735499.1 hypothetical protein F4V57_01490 [Acinetobacter qingfengensis]OEY95855.1 hypothetical protein BJI46_02755 [Acinetobacter qingfengensis]
MRYLSQCPSCQTIYRLSLSQINISDGRVKCAQCQHIFNALSNFILDPRQSISTEMDERVISVPEATTPSTSETCTKKIHNRHQQYVSEFMHYRVEGSKLNLQTYLNNLNRINPTPDESRKENILQTPYNPLIIQKKYNKIINLNQQFLPIKIILILLSIFFLLIIYQTIR